MTCNYTSTKKITQHDFMEKCQTVLGDSIHGYIFEKTIYDGYRKKITVECKVHGIFECFPNQILSGLGCKLCYKLLNPSGCTRLTLIEYKEIASKIHRGKYGYDSVNENNFKNEKIAVECKIHGIFQIRKSSHISPSQMYGCSKCTKSVPSKGEQKIENWLKDNNILYNVQKSFDGFTTHNNIPYLYDFYLPHYRVLIEYDGVHHFKPVKFSKKQSCSSAMKKFENIKKNDGIKNTWVIDNDLILIRISHTRFNDIENILHEEITKDRNATKCVQLGLGWYKMENVAFETPVVHRYTESSSGEFEIKNYM